MTPRERDDHAVRDARDEDDRAHEREDRRQAQAPADGERTHAANMPWTATADDGRWRSVSVIALLWLGVLAAPAAFMLELTTTFALVERACATGGSGLLLAITGAAALVAAAGGVQAWRSWRAVGEDPEPLGEGVERSAPRSTGHTLASELRTDAPGPVGRSRFMAMAGIAVSGFFLLMVLASAIPALVLGPCQ